MVFCSCLLLVLLVFMKSIAAFAISSSFLCEHSGIGVDGMTTPSSEALVLCQSCIFLYTAFASPLQLWLNRFIRSMLCINKHLLVVCFNTRLARLMSVN